MAKRSGSSRSADSFRRETKGQASEDESPGRAPLDSDSESVYDSAEDHLYEERSDDEEESEEESSDDEDEFEDQGSSDEDENLLEEQQQDDEDSEGEVDISSNLLDAYERNPRSWGMTTKRTATGADKKKAEETQALWMHTDDLSSDDEDDDGTGNRIGRVPLHWYDEFDHIGYDSHGKKVIKSASVGESDLIDQAIANSDNEAKGKFVVRDALNDKDVQLSARQLELIRRVQAGAYAHPEFDGNAEYIDYFSGVNPEISGINSNRTQPKSRFQPSKWERLQVRRLLDRLERGQINMDYLTGKIRDMGDAFKEKKDSNGLFMLWKGDEEDELATRKGPQHIAAPKLPPPGHALSYIPPDEYIPTEEEVKQWEEMDVQDRPHGLVIPKKFDNLRSVGAYPHSVRETFERCLDLYLCPRVLKRRLNIDPESLVPKLPKASDLRPFPTAKCIEYKTPYSGAEPPIIRCVTASPDGQFMASGASDGIVRLWEVESSRLLRSWDLAKLVSSMESGPATEDASAGSESTKPVVCLEWNPNRSHHCLIAGIGKIAFVIATGTAGRQDSEITEALLLAAKRGGNLSSTNKASKAVKWVALENHGGDPLVSLSGRVHGLVCGLQMNYEVTNLRWHSKGDYFVSVSPKAAAAAVLIHQLSKGNSQQPFSKAKGEAQAACFHPNKPFLFVASQQHVRIYHLVKQAMVKRLISGCRWISSIDIHPSGDHSILGSLDHRVIWHDLDLSNTPYKTLKYHERALRAVKFHNRYPLMASASDDGTVHVFHSMVYSDLMRNPLIVPVKILRGHSVRKKFGVLALAFHPTQSWLFSGGADGRIFLYQDI